MQLKLVLPLVGAVILLLTLVVAGLGAAREPQPAPLRTPTVALGSAPELEPQPGPLRTATFSLG